MMNQVEKKKRPVLVWLISIFHFNSAGWSLLFFYLVITEVVPLPLETKGYFDDLTATDWTLTTLL
jgi:hypothetical protein